MFLTRCELGARLPGLQVLPSFYHAWRVPLPPSLFAQNLDDRRLRRGSHCQNDAQSLWFQWLAKWGSRKIFKTRRLSVQGGALLNGTGGMFEGWRSAFLESDPGGP